MGEIVAFVIGLMLGVIAFFAVGVVTCLLVSKGGDFSVGITLGIVAGLAAGIGVAYGVVKALRG